MAASTAASFNIMSARSAATSERPVSKSYRDSVCEKNASAERPEPVPLTEELCEECVGEHPRTARVIELLFTSLEPLPALRCCERSPPLAARTTWAPWR